MLPYKEEERKMTEAIQAGMDARSKRIASTLKERGLPDAEIAEITGLDVAEVKKLRAKK